MQLELLGSERGDFVVAVSTMLTGVLDHPGFVIGEIELILFDHEDVADVAVLGVPDPELVPWELCVRGRRRSSRSSAARRWTDVRDGDILSFWQLSVAFVR